MNVLKSLDIMVKAQFAKVLSTISLHPYLEYHISDLGIRILWQLGEAVKNKGPWETAFTGVGINNFSDISIWEIPISYQAGLIQTTP